MVRITICFIIFFQAITVYSQTTDYSAFKGKPVKTSIPFRLDQPYFCEYHNKDYSPVRLKFKPDFNSNAAPENVILSAYCGKIAETTKVHKYNGIVPDKSKRNCLILYHKLTFNWQGTETAVVKFVEMKDSIGKPITVQLQHIGNNWKLVNLDGIQYIENVILSIRTNSFWDLYEKIDNKEPAVNEIKKKIKDNEGFINMSLLSDCLNQLRRKNPSDYKLICDN